ncbi:protein kinase C-binding protein NELL2-like isoform X2 [Coccinella septempunctata]|uniref:protein kinase C-binding protein NELL2-like isoform X2 n=1 Tax=Coccinella septempunctata TaxID=41139 RepID=UPI001D090843|nr:protein kinase C-binding protein NELL2-like isoform X2 [Coccinella septempunctata]
MAFSLLAAWTTLLWLASATGLDPSGLLSTINTTRQTIDLLGALGLPNTNWSGVSRTDGPQRNKPAYLLQGDNRNLKLPSPAFEQVSEMLRRSPEFTISAYLKQDMGNTGIILSFVQGYNRYLELESSGRKNEIRFHYLSKEDNKVHVETFHYKLADNLWHRMTVTVSGSVVELFVDCNRLYKRLLRPGKPDRNFTEAKQLWLGQRNRLYHYKGAMQDVQFIAGPHGYLLVCPHLDSTCPTCGQFSLLESTVQELTRHLQELTERLSAAEGRISGVEKCDCPISCHINGTVHADGARWQSGCDLCSCVHGTVECRRIECPKPMCKYPVLKEGECCPQCLRSCLMIDTPYDHGEVVSVTKCMDCECNDGSMNCKKINPETQCPKLTCPPEQRFSVADNCCKFCPGVDYCAKGHVCHANATCLNLQTTYACQCIQGYQGDGRNCTDIDECQQEGGQEGHHCHQNTRCVNTPGSYICECLPGYRRIDKFNCAELDECHTGEHECDVNAECINTQGSYHCKCKEGYSGDGYKCEPICEQSCMNGGICKKPGICACANGYTGPSCERDLDECATNAHRCTSSSRCVNMIGWYYCTCKEGFKGPGSDNNLGTLCTDINECEEEIDSCHPSATCVNTLGGFECRCPPRKPDCRLSCLFEQTEIDHGKTLSHPNDPCTKCTCNRGVIKCEKVSCNCSIPAKQNDPCCPQCDLRQACAHQELPGVDLMHGEKWSYQCQSCECLYGETDCSNLECPPLLCSKPVQGPNDCCPHCEEDQCMWNATGDGRDCNYISRSYKSGSEFVDPNDPCVTCKCKVPFCAELDGSICCSYNLHCNDNAVAVGFDGVTVPSSSPQQHKIVGSTQISTSYGQYSSSYRLDSSSVTSTYQKKSEQAEGITVPSGG